MNEKTKGIRELAKAYRDVADAADKMADLMEKKDCTDAELDEALKELVWLAAKIVMVM